MFKSGEELFENANSETFSVLRALCNPSQSTNADVVKVVFVIVDKISGVPYGGFCTCTVGHSGTCGHIGAVLFRTADFLALGSFEAIKWGRKNEPKARQAYINKFQHWHKNCTVSEHGLVVCSEYNFICGSPDGIVHCACHGKRLLVIKCRYSARAMSVTEAVQSRKIKYLGQENGRFVLRKETPGGYCE
ncbi:hypothetical protein MAR_006664 [Mya arenaria]|uniref:SWIM-type domain-containing protein n=1 Tax=Mya arenaria TaxID=6604 RepID=A0ABY7DBA9_MYAAR|nr:hypothetical protein MAR_006664 [Mya arenaria]